MGVNEKERAGLDETLKNLKLSDEEVGKFTKAFQDPEFLKIFEEYAKEISDPKNREETDLYLRQLEAEGRAEEVYGKGVQLVVPNEAFVIKTRNLSAPEGQSDKVFINVCTSDKVEKMRSKVGTGPDGRKGTHFEIPLSLGTMKKGKDKEGRPCSVWDFVVHPETVEAAAKNPVLMGMLADTAMEKVEQVDQGARLHRKYKMPKMKYTGTEEHPKPHVLGIRTGDGKAGESVNGRIKPLGPDAQPAAQPAAAGAAGGTATAAGAAGAPGGTHTAAGAAGAPGGTDAAAAGAQGSRSKFAFPAPQQQQQQAKQPSAGQAVTPTAAGYKHPGGEVTPEWQLVHRGQIDLAEAWGDSGRKLHVNQTCPKDLVVRVQLPAVASATALELNVGPRSFAVSVPGKFLLDTPLPFTVDDSKGRAKFDKARQQLEVVLPVVPPPRPAMPLQAAAAQVQEVQEEVTADVEEQEEARSSGAEPRAEAAGAVPGSGDVAGSGGLAAEADAGPAGSAAGDAPVPELSELSENQRRWLELHGGAHGPELQQQLLQQQQEQIQQQQAHQQADGGLGAPGEPAVSGSGGSEASSSAARAAAALMAAGITAPVAPPSKVPTAAAAAAAAAPPPIKLKPRLTSSLADDLD
mmetsp:Transcript_19984/g.43576  ORF Transcript_19984/g.43576 Transcript_19984/m.43576 type:complete len:633 (+) Transcript_19984:162-2060(+)